MPFKDLVFWYKLLEHALPRVILEHTLTGLFQNMPSQGYFRTYPPRVILEHTLPGLF